MRGYFLTKPVAVRAAVGCAVLIPLFATGGLDDAGWSGVAWGAVFMAAFSLLYYLGVVDRDRGQRRRKSANS